MKKFKLFLCLALTLVFVMNAFASDGLQMVVGHDAVLHGGNSNFSKDISDTFFVIGPWSSDALVNGQFQSPDGSPAWNGWTHNDMTQKTETAWHVSDFAGSEFPGGPGNLIAYCGDETIASCGFEGDAVGGYGNDYNDVLRFSYQVPDPNNNCTMTVSGLMNHCSEPGYDYVYFEFRMSDGQVVMKDQVDGISEAAFAFSYNQVYSPVDYTGADGDYVVFDIRVFSDSGRSDVDCLWDDAGDGFCQFDDITVHCTNGNYTNFNDFEIGLGLWVPSFDPGVGDFTQIWPRLYDIDPCSENTTPQVAFIDDGLIVPGVGPTLGISWLYGPNGWIPNNSGGASGSSGNHLKNELLSPVIEVPSEYDGASFAFDVYSHELLEPNSSGMMYYWNLRSTADEVNLPIADEGWQSRGFYYSSGASYTRGGDGIISDLIVPGATHIQVQLQCTEMGWVWGADGDDGSPGPYFDNVRFTLFNAYGPSLSTTELQIAGDRFTEHGNVVDLVNLACNNVRFDMVQTDNPTVYSPGDSITCDITSTRAGANLLTPRLYYSMMRNPVFDSVRDPVWDTSGSVYGTRNGTTNNFWFDLPDSGFLFPGDVLHYYFEAKDEVGHGDIESATLPANLDGFGDFSRPLTIYSIFTVNALPSIKPDGSQPGILFWNDSGADGGGNEWYRALSSLCLVKGYDYDVFTTKGPSSGEGNGLGGLSSYLQIQDYSDLLYTAGNLESYTLGTGEGSDPSADIPLLNQWFNNGVSRDAFLTGDNLVSDLSGAGTLGAGFLADILGVVWRAKDVRSFINNQTTPLVIPVQGNEVFYTTPTWYANGGCPDINTFDAVEAGDGASRLAEFANSSGSPGGYIYSAATLNYHGQDNDRIISMPYGFMHTRAHPNSPFGGSLTRIAIMREILSFFQIPFHGWCINALPDAEVFFARNYPNPFNPTTRIEFNLPQAGHLTLKIFNVRGELVKTLVDETREAGSGHIMWDGTNTRGSRVSSGVYFFEARAAGEVQISKMALVK